MFRTEVACHKPPRGAVFPSELRASANLDSEISGFIFMISFKVGEIILAPRMLLSLVDFPPFAAVLI